MIDLRRCAEVQLWATIATFYHLKEKQAPACECTIRWMEMIAGSQGRCGEPGCTSAQRKGKAGEKKSAEQTEVVQEEDWRKIEPVDGPSK